MRARSKVLAAIVGASVAAFGLSAPASAGEKVREEGYAVYPSDGDTVWVCLTTDKCDPKDKNTWTSVRLMSIQAMEVVHNGSISSEAKAAGVPSMTVNQCHGAEATAALNKLVFGSSTWSTAKKSPYKVRLKSEKASSSSYGRLRRTVEVYRDGVWIDVQAELLQQGHVMFMPLPSSLGEDAHNASYAKLAQQAAIAGKNLWDTDYCGSGPSQDAKLEIDVRYDANGDDTKNPNGEWARIRNLGTKAVNLKGWSLRTASWQVRDFTSDTWVQPGNWIMVHSGKKPSKVKDRHYYFGQSSSFLQNTVGGGMYLFDKDGDLRFSSQYFCSVGCKTNPGLKITSVVADAKGVDAKNLNGEYVKITNTSKATIKLAPYTVKLGNTFFSFSATASVAAGKTVTVKMGKGTNTATTKYVGASSPVLSNGGGTIKVMTYTGTTLTSKSW